MFLIVALKTLTFHKVV